MEALLTGGLGGAYRDEFDGVLEGELGEGDLDGFRGQAVAVDDVLEFIDGELLQGVVDSAFFGEGRQEHVHADLVTLVGHFENVGLEAFGHIWGQ